MTRVFPDQLDEVARNAGGWPSSFTVFAVEVIGEGDDPAVLCKGAEPFWMPSAKRWSWKGRPAKQAMIRLSEYRAALAKAVDDATD